VERFVLCGNSADDDAMARAVGAVLRRLDQSASPRPLLVCRSAGTPAMTVARTVHAVDRFGSQCTVVSLPPGSAAPRERHGRRWLQQSALLARARRELEPGEFGRAARSLQQAGVPGAFRQLVPAGDHRLAYHCNEARASARQPLRDPHTRRIAEGRRVDWPQRLRDALRPLLDQWETEAE
jgi:hypothetical protein